MSTARQWSIRGMLVFAHVAILLSASAFAQRADAQPAPKVDATEATTGYVIGPEDVLSIRVSREPELTLQVFVRPDGMISYPLLNDVPAAGLTPLQLQQRLTEGLAQYVNTPQVSVLLLEIRSNVVYLHGAVGRPGVYPLGGPMTVIELLVRAGGLSEFAKSEEIQIVRAENGAPVRYRFNFKTFLDGKDYKQNIPLRRGDIVMVP
jgi:polysaccharide biosynthesis/export protein